MSKSELLLIEKTVRGHLRDHFSSPGDVSLVVGVSGGADSMALLHILHRLDVTLHVVHLNYQKRGKASDKDAALVKQTADNLGGDAKIVRVDPDEAEGQNFQQWARQVRYRAFEMKQRALKADGIAVGHHRNDQIETILQKIFRGAGLAGWSAMRVWDGRLFRPLLGVSRSDIEAYCIAKDIRYRHDESNFTSYFARNFLRNEWLSKLDKHFPGWGQNVLRVGEQAEVFASAMKVILQKISDDKDRIKRDDFLALDESLQKSLIAHRVHDINPDVKLSRHALSELSKLSALQTGKSLQLSKQLSLMRDRDFLKLVWEHEQDISGLTLQKDDLQEGGVLFNGFHLELQPYKNPDFKHKLYLSVEALNWPMKLRRWREGDRFQPLGMEGHQSVADHLTNRKVPAADKPRVLVLESFEDTICAVIFTAIKKEQPPGTISELVRCHDATRQCVTITQTN